MEPVKIFISYASKNGKIAEQTCEYLEKQGKSCWIAPRDIAAGTEYGEEIIKGIENSDVFVLLFSEASNQSQHVLREVERAVSKKTPVIAFRLDETIPSKSFEYFLLTNQWLDASKRPKEMLSELSESIDRLAKESDEREAELLEDKTETRPAPERRVIAFVLSLIALGVIAIAVILALKLREPKETAVPEENPTENPTEAPAEETGKIAFSKIEAGSFLLFGRYLPEEVVDEDGAILWQVVKKDEATQSLTLVSSKILDLVPFDCAESGHYNKDKEGVSYDRNLLSTYSMEKMVEFRGSNLWETSDLRAWLNTVGPVSYTNLLPTDRATDETGNAFGLQSGFLTAFREEERSLLQKENGEDLVRLLSVEEVENYVSQKTLTRYAKVTSAAVKSDDTSWYNAYESMGAQSYLWATSTPSEDSSYLVMIVNPEIKEERYGKLSAAASGFGLRPSVTISLSSIDQTLQGEGTEADPYLLFQN